MSLPTIDDLIALTAECFARGKSRTYPYIVSRFEGLRVLQDTPSRKNMRKSEVFVHSMPPEDVIDRIHRCGVGWHFLCVAHTSAETSDEVRRAYKGLGYRVMATEWLYARSLVGAIPSFDCDPPVRLADEATFAAIPQQARQPRRFRHDGTRHYCIWDESESYGWVHSVPFGKVNYVSDLYVEEAARNRGFGKALMSRMLHDDRELGVESSVLVASAAGSRIYPALGYEEIGQMQVFCPARRT